MLRWKAAADAAENDIDTRVGVMAKNEAALQAIERELQNASADKGSKEGFHSSTMQLILSRFCH